MAGYFGHVGGHVPPYSVGSHGLSHPAPNIDFFSQMAPPPCGKFFSKYTIKPITGSIVS